MNKKIKYREVNKTSKFCSEIHKVFNNLTKFTYPFNVEDIPRNGIEIFFEKGEKCHGVDRIVRIGTHLALNGLSKRLLQHFESNKNNSVFRQNIGNCFLNFYGNSYLVVWEKQMNPKKVKEKYGHLIEKNFEDYLEKIITEYMKEKLSFCVIRIDDRIERLKLKSKLISTISLCEECKPSKTWFGLYSPKEKIIGSGLWQENDLYKEPISDDDFNLILEKIKNIKNKIKI